MRSSYCCVKWRIQTLRRWSSLGETKDLGAGLGFGLKIRGGPPPPHLHRSLLLHRLPVWHNMQWWHPIYSRLFSYLTNTLIVVVILCKSGGTCTSVSTVDVLTSILANSRCASTYNLPVTCNSRSRNTITPTFYTYLKKCVSAALVWLLTVVKE